MYASDEYKPYFARMADAIAAGQYPFDKGTVKFVRKALQFYAEKNGYGANIVAKSFYRCRHGFVYWQYEEMLEELSKLRSLDFDIANCISSSAPEVREQQRDRISIKGVIETVENVFEKNEILEKRETIVEQNRFLLSFSPVGNYSHVIFDLFGTLGTKRSFRCNFYVLAEDGDRAGECPVFCV